MNEFARKVLMAPLGKTYLFSVGQAGFIIKSKSGQLLGIDLYLSDCVERVEGHVGFKRMLPKLLGAGDLQFNAVIATHSHKDHFDDDSIPELLAGHRTKLYASTGCEADVKRLNLECENITYITAGMSEECGDFKMDFIRCDHGQAAPDAVGVIVTVDGKIICETGDTCLRLDWADEYKSKGSLDVLIAPINGMYGNMDAEDCARLAEAIQPKLTIPCHYGMFASHFGSPGEFCRIMKERYSENKFSIMTQGEGIAME